MDLRHHLVACHFIAARRAPTRTLSVRCGTFTGSKQSLPGRHPLEIDLHDGGYAQRWCYPDCGNYRSEWMPLPREMCLSDNGGGNGRELPHSSGPEMRGSRAFNDTSAELTVPILVVVKERELTSELKT